MIPSLLAKQVRQGVEDFLKTTFPISTPFFHGLVENLLAEDGEVFKGPYLSVQLPFRQGKDGTDTFPDVPLSFPPYMHQEQAFKRLGGSLPQSTIVATGTGSGKTECFLYPILDYCYRTRDEKGIKAILIYPMNALATDQAERLAKIIYNNPNLKGNVTAGLFVGEREKHPSSGMGPDWIVTDKPIMRKVPPNILLTNYKMLDYLLIRSRDYPLWQVNGPETLRFLVVDELHTFDGAQGTDLACLLRRLKSRLKTPEKYLCCVGTSATLGTEGEQKGLKEYAEKVFGETFPGEAIVTESRITAGEFLEDSLVKQTTVVAQEDAEALSVDNYDDFTSYMSAQVRLWFDEEIDKAQLDNDNWRVDLGSRLQEHLFFQNLLKSLKGQIRSYEEVVGELDGLIAGIGDTPWQYKVDLLDSMLSITSLAKRWVKKAGGEKVLAPFLHVRLQNWMRELRRMVCKVSKEPKLRFADDLNSEQRKTHLPILHCRECGVTAWGATKRKQDQDVIPDLQQFYSSFFSNSRNVVFLFPEDGEDQTPYLDGAPALLCPDCLHLNTDMSKNSCTSCDSKKLVRIFLPNIIVKRGKKVEGSHDCPYCGARDSMTIIGSRAASLTSVQIAQLYSSSFNDDKKLLAFSDSVQDAAHRAGFFGARTYRFNFRGALQKYVLEEGDGLPLSDLPEGFFKYWLDRMDKETYAATFLAPNMEWFSEYETLISTGKIPAGSNFLEEMNQRVGWEILSEYGFSARIGRTLEKTGSSVVHLDQEKLDVVVKQLLEPLQNEVGGLRDLKADDLRRFLLGLIVQLKNRGAVYQSSLKNYIDSWGNTFRLKNVPWMPNFGPKTRAPGFLTDKSGVERFDSLVGAKGCKTWYGEWVEKCFTKHDVLIGKSADLIYREALKALVHSGIFLEMPVKGKRVWGIQPEVMRVSSKVVQFRCERCGHNASVADMEKSDWQGAPCLRFHCGGSYVEEPPKVDYYNKLYAKGDVQRIFTAEHTGLLSRDKREDLEKRFKAVDGKPWDPNLLSCTPTLEMGIDIGDLSSLILCSVPPSPANYIQRIGRAGRRDGNSLDITVANGRPHDLFFFADPIEMISGRIANPGVFLNASAVLERQLTAFCFDKWVETKLTEAALPPQLGSVLNSLSTNDVKKFPFNLLQFITDNRTSILEDFIAMFSGQVDSKSQDHLKSFAEGTRENEGSLTYRILEGFFALAKERDSLQAKIKQLQGKINKIQEDPAKDLDFQEQLDELEQERKSFLRLNQHIQKKETLNFFTDEGLIPNYSFPEAGVMLRSIILRKKKAAESDKGRFESYIYEYERPAMSAISELAPANRFYAGSRKVEINQIDMNVSEVEMWRFCPECSHMEREIKLKSSASCPRCGAALWSDSGQKGEMIRMRMVFATTFDSNSRIADDSDDRDPKFYNKQMLVDIEDKHISEAYFVDSEDYAFGFEFLQKATMREINFGEKDEFASKSTIAGQELARKGFSICKHCGKVKKDRGEFKHALSCTAKNADADQNFIQLVYLYREFSSEAIRILMPFLDLSGSTANQHSFIAALQLGLKKRFQGNIDHLQVTLQEEPVPKVTLRKKYLVLYDTVPGGTGYLKELMRSEEPLVEVMQLALTALQDCACNEDPDKDGCYQCLFAYRNSYDMASTSRNAAIDLLQQILSFKDKLKKTSNLSHVKINPLFDSELELRFLEALSRIPKENGPAALSKKEVNGKPGYQFEIGGQVYDIELQRNLGPEDNVAVRSKADFIFWPKAKDVKPIVVFTDGYAFHFDRIGLDVAQRMAIAKSGKFHVWSITWKDVENQFQDQGHYYENLLKHEQNDLYKQNNLQWLIQFLKKPDEAEWQESALIQGVAFLAPEDYPTDEDTESWFERLHESFPESMSSELDYMQPPFLLGEGASSTIDGDAPARWYCVMTEEAARKHDRTGFHLFCCLQDDLVLMKSSFEPVWNGFLRLYNLFQFLPGTFFITSSWKSD